ncbi:MAG: spore coat protein [Lachnospiraceae bacterium]|jgi:spore coat polysaccharide biosynthesis protein SpsF|nr:spore coat protein [Lachnospiraceae bacterium]
MKYIAMIQARCGSTRLPDKVLKDLAGKTDLQWVIERVRRSKALDEAMVVTSIEKDNLPLIRLCAELNVRVFAGSEEDVLDRYYQAAKLLKPDYVVRITADCPLFDWRYLDMAAKQMEAGTDYMAGITESFPDGEDIEIITYDALKQSWEKAAMASEREHVTMYIKNHPGQFRLQNLECPIPGLGMKRWTLDEEEDYQFISAVYQHFTSQGREDFVTEDILAFLKEHPELEGLNVKYQRNEGLLNSIQNDRIVGLER